jgi:hypothetical protein
MLVLFLSKNGRKGGKEKRTTVCATDFTGERMR